MPKISQKGILMPESPIRKLVPFAEAAKAKGKKVIHLNIGQPDIETPKEALEAIKNNHINILTYSHSAGLLSYREKLVDYYKTRNVAINTDDLIVTTGGSEAIIFALGSVTDYGDEIIIPEPFYANYNGFSISNGVHVIPVTSTIENGFTLPSINDFEKLITSKTKAIVICNPGNPTGYLYSIEELNQLKELVIKHDLFLIADEVYREFTYDGATHTSILSFDELKEHAIVIDSVSKRYSMCGARVGCMVSKNTEVVQTAMKFAQARLSPPTFAQIASEAALSVDNSYFEAINKEYIKRRNILIEGLNKIEGVYCPTPKGAFYCMAQLPVKNADHFAQWLLEDFSINDETVMVAPAAGFYASSKGQNEIRIAYVLNENELKKAIHIIEKALEVYTNNV